MKLEELLRYRTNLKPTRWALAHTVLMTLVFCFLAAIALYYSLGYKFNWSTKRLQQTGMIILDSRVQSSGGFTVKVNSTSESLQFPHRIPYLFPGNYTLTISQKGYQTFTRTVKIEENLVRNFRNLVLVTEQESFPLTPSEREVSRSLDSSGIEIRDQNELWLDEKFLTRTSQSILAVRWYTDNRAIAFQTPTGFWLYSPELQATQALAQLESEKTLPFSFAAGGKVLVIDTESGSLERTLFE